MSDEMYELMENISDAVHELVNQMTAGLNEDDDEEIRQSLTEEFRFWRRLG